MTPKSINSLIDARNSSQQLHLNIGDVKEVDEEGELLITIGTVDTRHLSSVEPTERQSMSWNSFDDT